MHWDIRHKKRYKLTEGGAIYTAMSGDRYLVIIDESMMAEFMEDEGDIELVNIVDFNSESERESYLKRLLS
ncbi:hypothetical protein DRW07_01990 [Alteromonas sediminis]|uniref:Uncharacterized protein n=1 Tax=Alteromonas sediminis TaxID=2259342 RepID=A0A3N5Y2Z6_9ALTE|nr:hypothetical protein [Alteromonas sediminis]RPJ68202.1 hypothetical protein DRW07_01990 [Alteromonas sediminis]